VKRLLFLFVIVICVGTLLQFSNTVFAEGEEINEDEIFSSSDTVVNQEQVVKDNVDSELKDNHIGFSGQISANIGYYNDVKYYDDSTGSLKQLKDSDVLSNMMESDLFMDIRLKQGVKGFLSVGGQYYPALSKSEEAKLGADSTKDYYSGEIKEFFVDTNLQNKIYFRIGKQVLKWGQGYYWNPTDLINIEKKSFTDMDSIREGTYGIKTQVPFGVKQNIYLFTDMQNTSDPGAVAQAAKYEFLVGGTEMSISAWAKEGNKPVFGYDFTGRLGDVDLRGEMSLRDGSEYTLIDYDTLSSKDLSGQIIPQICLGFTKAFDQGDIKDRISLTGEFYYNQAGYERNIVKRVIDSGDTNAQAQLLSSYNPYQNSKYYMALFSSVSKFWGPDTAFNFNVIANLVDNSAFLVTGLSYAPTINNITIDFNIGCHVGDKYSEATLLGERYYLKLVTTIKF
jgi:hypothetical protein